MIMLMFVTKRISITIVLFSKQHIDQSGADNGFKVSGLGFRL